MKSEWTDRTKGREQAFLSCLWSCMRGSLTCSVKSWAAASTLLWSVSAGQIIHSSCNEWGITTSTKHSTVYPNVFLDCNFFSCFSYYSFGKQAFSVPKIIYKTPILSSISTIHRPSFPLCSWKIQKIYVACKTNHTSILAFTAWGHWVLQY